jgi:hypothetical protein
MIGIIDWRLAQCEALGVSSASTPGPNKLICWPISPDVVIVATGGLPQKAGLAGATI